MSDYTPEEQLHVVSSQKGKILSAAQMERIFLRGEETKGSPSSGVNVW
jgi:hypothetical protein